MAMDEVEKLDVMGFPEFDPAVAYPPHSLVRQQTPSGWEVVFVGCDDPDHDHTVTLP